MDSIGLYSVFYAETRPPVIMDGCLFARTGVDGYIFFLILMYHGPEHGSNTLS